MSSYLWFLHKRKQYIHNWERFRRTVAEQSWSEGYSILFRLVVDIHQLHLSKFVHRSFLDISQLLLAHSLHLGGVNLQKRNNNISPALQTYLLTNNTLLMKGINGYLTFWNALLFSSFAIFLFSLSSRLSLSSILVCLLTSFISFSNAWTAFLSSLIRCFSSNVLAICDNTPRLFSADERSVCFAFQSLPLLALPTGMIPFVCADVVVFSIPILTNGCITDSELMRKDMIKIVRINSILGVLDGWHAPAGDTSDLLSDLFRFF